MDDAGSVGLLGDAHLARLIVDVSPAGKVIVNSKGIIVFANRQAEKWLGYEAAELVGEPVEILVPDLQRDNHSRLQKRYHRAPQARSMAAEKNLFAKKKDGGEFPVDISLHPFESQGERFVLANILDATVRRQAARVPEERLAAIGEMVAGLAHESRNALQRARACLDLLELDLEGQVEQLDLTARIRKALKDLEHHYDEVRNYAAPITIDPSDVDLEALIAEVMDDMRVALPGTVVSLTIANESEITSNRLDRHRIKQVVRNCVENAVQASEEHSNAAVLVRLRDEKDSGGHWQIIEFEDQGQGASAETIERMFEPFFTTKQKGTGLGLAICRRIVESHGGSISARPNAPQGLVVSVAIPIRT